MSKAIVLNDVGKRFGARHVLRGIRASVKQGAIVSLVGASGSGKTTLLRCLNGLEAIDAGSIEIAGHRLLPKCDEGALTRLRFDVGMVFQDYQLFPHLSVLDNLCLAPCVVRGRNRADAEQRARVLLEQVGLGDRAGSRPSELSGGQKQRIALAPWPTTPRCCCSTSPPARSTKKRATKSSASCVVWSKPVRTH
jgi:polar amino acid transport system ATP-binding protein